MPAPMPEPALAVDGSPTLTRTLDRTLTPVFGAAMTLSAALLFLVQPMAAKLLLPTFGGSPAVWSTALLFFQVALLGAYGYAHVATRRLRTRHRAVVHLALALVPLVVLPMRLPP